MSVPAHAKRSVRCKPCSGMLGAFSILVVDINRYTVQKRSVPAIINTNCNEKEYKITIAQQPILNNLPGRYKSGDDMARNNKTQNVCLNPKFSLFFLLL